VQSEQNTKLYRSYVMSDASSVVLRHRGKSPRQAAFFFRNPEVNFQAAQLASVLVLHGLLGGTALGIEPRYRVGSLDSGRCAWRTSHTRTCMFLLRSPSSMRGSCCWRLHAATSSASLSVRSAAVCA